MMKWIRTSRLSIKNFLSLDSGNSLSLLIHSPKRAKIWVGLRSPPCDVVRGFCFMILGSLFMILGSCFVVLGCWFVVLGSWFWVDVSPRGVLMDRFGLVRSCWLTEQC